MSRPYVVITGAAGFIGSHLTDRLLGAGFAVVGIDNLLRGTRQNLTNALRDPAFTFLEQDVNDFEGTLKSVRQVTGGSVVALWHLAANSDIPAGIEDPEVDLRLTFMTTFNSLKLARALKVPRFMFASSSAVYGDHAATLTEVSGPLLPISNYGAMKLASEGLISAAVETHLARAYLFRFPNVVGDRATHGVIYDLIGKLKRNPSELEVLGDGNQMKPYLHVRELIDAMLHIVEESAEKVSYLNVAGEGEGTTVRYIAERVRDCVAPAAQLRFTGGSKGWKGDVPRFSYSTAKLQKLGWSPKLTSNEVIDRAVQEIAAELLS